ncbi:hypothetical protein RI367_003517 [Sorochytrium milnesiophthora]
MLQLSQSLERRLNGLGQPAEDNDGKHCPHKGSCLKSCSLAGAKWFTIVVLIKAALAALPSVLRGKAWSRPELLIRGLNLDSAQQALFVSAFSAVYRAITCWIRNATGEPLNKRAAFAAGCVAGLSFLLDRNRERRGTVALYALMKTGHFLGRLALHRWETRLDAIDQAERGRLKRCDSALGSPNFSDFEDTIEHGEKSPATTSSPTAQQRQVMQWLTRHAGTALVVLSGCQIVLSFWIKPDTLPPSYYHFLLKFSGVKARMGPASSTYLKQVSDAFQRPLARRTAAMTSDFHSHMCAVMHPEMESCTQFSAVTVARSFCNAVPMYSALAMLSALVFNRHKTAANPLASIAHMVKSTLRSSVFLSASTSLPWLFACYVHRLFQRTHPVMFVLCFFPAR